MTSDPLARELLQLISEGFVFVDRDFCVRAMNAEAERIDQRRAHDVVGRTLWEAWPNLGGSKLEKLWRSALAEQMPVSLEHCYRWPDGREAWLEMRAYPSDGGLAIFFRDISDRKRAEAELARTQGELIHASRLSAMGAMAATLAHELSQPLTAISNYIESANKRLRTLPPAEARQARQALGFASAATERAREILKRLRGFVAKGRVETEIHDIQSIIADASVLILPAAQREGVEIQYRLDRQAKWVKADAIQVQQVLINLIRNAIEAMVAADERKITISTAARPDGQIEITVQDTGGGIDQPADALFAPFHSTKADGLGVGLSISRTIVEAHGGTIAAEPAEGGGALFRFTLPRAAGPRGSVS